MGTNQSWGLSAFRAISCLRWVLVLGCVIVSMPLCGGFALGQSRKPRKPPSASVKALPRPLDRYALIIGVETYDDTSGIPSIKGPNNDAIEISRALKAYAGFPPENVVVLA